MSKEKRRGASAPPRKKTKKATAKPAASPDVAEPASVEAAPEAREPEAREPEAREPEEREPEEREPEPNERKPPDEAWTDAAGKGGSRWPWAVLALAPIALDVVAGIYAATMAQPDRSFVCFAGVSIAFAIGARIPLIALAIADRDSPSRGLWIAGLALAPSLVAPAYYWLRVRTMQAEILGRVQARFLPIGRGVIVASLGFGATFLLMANEEQTPRGPLWGMLAMLAGTIGLLDALKLSRAADGTETPLAWRKTTLFTKEGEPVFFTPLVTVPVAITALAIGIQLGGYDHLPATILVALATLVPSAARRPGLLVAVVAGFLYLPFLGVYGLWDPWETHYGEVAREILSRDDWISLWWAQEDWFWSKPILIFWSESLSMGALGVDFHPDANPAHPEWAIRLPHFFLATGALLSVYALVSRVWSKRAGVVAALVLATMPHFFFLAHQAITDMPFVSCLTMAMCMLGLSIAEDPAREVKRYALGPITVSARHLVAFALTIVAVPQILYLISRNVTFMELPPPFGWHGDLFMHGSAGNHGIPGNAPVHNQEPYLGGVLAQPAAQAVLWLAGYAGILAILRKERRAQALYAFAFYFFCGLAFMAKGIPGFALPGLVALFFLIGARRWDLLLEGRLRIGAGMLVVIVTGMPWYVAMYMRHGPAFTERLLIHDHINRLTSGVHGDTGSIEYFVEQMGYGLFPWIALAPIALMGWLELGKDAPEETKRGRRRREITLLITLWLASAFTLFSAMTTKFHHYIFPTVPAAGILVGIAVDRMLGPRPKRFGWRSAVGAVLGVLAPVPAILGVAGLSGDVRGLIPDDVEGTAATDWALMHPWPTANCVALIMLSIGLLAAAWWVLAPHAKEAKPERSRWRPAALTTGLLTAPVLVALVGRDLSWVTDARPQGYERLIHLFVYNYGRPWPEQFDYRPILTGFAIVATIIVLLAAVRPLRGAATRAFLGLALAFSVWSLDVYMIDLSPHWGQRELVQRYYEERTGPNEPLVAWQMNWKGENFYSGNRVSVFVDLDNQRLQEWVREHQGTTAYFMLEHSRLGSLRGVLRDATIEEVTDERLNNKFLLIRAQIGQRRPSPAARETLD